MYYVHASINIVAYYFFTSHVNILIMSIRRENYTIADLRKVYPAPKTKREKKYPEPPKGMTELAPILTSMARDIKIIRRAQDIQSAEKWANEMNAKHNTGYTAKWEDLDGDKVPDLVVRDSKRDDALITVNGYTTIPSSWPETLKYGADLPYDKRREMKKKGEQYPNKSEWSRIFTGIKSSVDNPFELDISNLNENRYDEFGGVSNLIEKGYKVKSYSADKKYKQSAYQAFNKYVFQPIFTGLKDALSLKAKEKEYTQFDRDWSFIFPSVGSITKACAISYNDLVVNPVVHYVTGPEAEQVLSEPALMKKLKTKGVFKVCVKNNVMDMINCLRQETKDGSADKTAQIIEIIYNNNPMLGKIGFFNKDSQDYKDIIGYVIGHIKKEYTQLIKEREYQNISFGSPVKPKRNPNEVVDEEADDYDNFVQPPANEDRD